MFRHTGVLLFLCLLTLTPIAAQGDEWPAYQRDAARSGVTHEPLELPLRQAWAYTSAHEPSPAWPPPAAQDYWHEFRELKPRMTFDRAYQPIIGGGRLYFGSSSDDKVYALDAATGSLLWSFFAEGPVRFAPAYADGRLYFGADDGKVYCLDAKTGEPIWTRRVAPDDYRLPGNGRMMSLYPIRTGVIVENNAVYCCAGIFPAYGVHVAALDARDGEPLWIHQTEEFAPQGYMLASSDRLYAPTGRTSPVAFSRQDGSFLGKFGGEGGAYALLVDGALLSEDTRQGGGLRMSDTASQERIASFNGLRMVASEGMAYLQTKTSITAFDRARHQPLARKLSRMEDEMKQLETQAKRGPDEAARDAARKAIEAMQPEMNQLRADMAACTLWERPHAYPFDLVLAGGVLFAGGVDEVAAIRVEDGSIAWKHPVNGQAHGLAIADGRLYVSTSQGSIYCFTPGDPASEAAQAIQAAVHRPTPPDAASAEAAWLLKTAWSGQSTPKGYALLLGCGDGSLALALAEQSALQIVCWEPDPQRITAARQLLDTAGLYGKRVSIHQAVPGKLPYATGFANLVTWANSGATPDASQLAEAFRVTRPLGGMLCLPSAMEPVKAICDPEGIETAAQTVDGRMVFTRGAMPGAGEWLSHYANPGNTACSGDGLQGPMWPQWFGEPGPRRIVDRHHRPMASLARNGRIFVPADDSVVAVDAYNGAILWDLPMPRSRRIGIMRNAGQMALSADELYVATEGYCHVVSQAGGSISRTLTAPWLDGAASDWGYLGLADNNVIGSCQARGASLDILAKDTINYLIEGDYRPIIISHALFSMDPALGEVRWTYRNGRIANSAVAMDENRVFLLESRNPETMANLDGRIRLDVFGASGAFLTALDLKTGQPLWETPFACPYDHVVFLSFKDGVLLATGSYNEGNSVYYGLYAFNADSGAPLWENRFLATNVQGTEPTGLEGSHGEQWQHPVLIEDRVFLRPYDFNLHTGAKGTYHLYRGGHGCGGLTGSLHYLYGRGSNPRMYPVDVETTDGIRLTYTTRPGCYLNIIPAGGLILIPESSAGCTCAYSMQTSLAFIPKAASGMP